MHLSEKNASAAFEQLNRCLNDVKEWMSTSKLKLNPDKTEFIIFGSKRQRDKVKVFFPIDILGSPLCPVNSLISDKSGGFLLMMFLYLWLMLLLVVGWITATHFSGASPSPIRIRILARSNQSHTATLHTYTPNQCAYQVTTFYTLQFPRYSPDKIL